jgi:hypothetical protein
MAPAAAPKTKACRAHKPTAKVARKPPTRAQVVTVIETQLDYVIERGTMADARMRRQWKRMVTNMDDGEPRALLLDLCDDSFIAACKARPHESMAEVLDRELDALLCRKTMADVERRNAWFAGVEKTMVYDLLLAPLREFFHVCPLL